ncbi:MAG: hypothetical protein ACYTFV_13965 [Planctomycetota bacterium]|jgi:hypothetical protein
MNEPNDDRVQRELDALEGLLDDQPVPEVPAGLAERVLEHTAAERGARSAPQPRMAGPESAGAGVSGPRTGWTVGVALAAAAALLLWLGGVFDSPESVTEEDQVARLPQDDGPVEALEVDVVEAAPDGLLAELELLEDWDLLVTDDLDVLLAELDTLDEALLTVVADEESEEQG